MVELSDKNITFGNLCSEGKYHAVVQYVFSTSEDIDYLYGFRMACLAGHTLVANLIYSSYGNEFKDNFIDVLLDVEKSDYFENKMEIINFLKFIIRVEINNYNISIY